MDAEKLREVLAAAYRKSLQEIEAFLRDTGLPWPRSCDVCGQEARGESFVFPSGEERADMFDVCGRCRSGGKLKEFLDPVNHDPEWFCSLCRRTRAGRWYVTRVPRLFAVCEGCHGEGPEARLAPRALGGAWKVRGVRGEAVRPAQDPALIDYVIPEGLARAGCGVTSQTAALTVAEWSKPLDHFGELSIAEGDGGFNMFQWVLCTPFDGGGRALAVRCAGRPPYGVALAVRGAEVTTLSLRYEDHADLLREAEVRRARGCCGSLAEHVARHG